MSTYVYISYPGQQHQPPQPNQGMAATPPPQPNQGVPATPPLLPDQIERSLDHKLMELDIPENKLDLIDVTEEVI